MVDHLEQAKKNPDSRKYAIKAKCYDCVGRDVDTGWVSRVRYCVCVDCPLHHVRPFK